LNSFNNLLLLYNYIVLFSFTKITPTEVLNVIDQLSLNNTFNLLLISSCIHWLIHWLSEVFLYYSNL